MSTVTEAQRAEAIARIERAVHPRDRSALRANLRIIEGYAAQQALELEPHPADHLVGDGLRVVETERVTRGDLEPGDIACSPNGWVLVVGKVPTDDPVERVKVVGPQ